MAGFDDPEGSPWMNEDQMDSMLDIMSAEEIDMLAGRPQAVPSFVFIVHGFTFLVFLVICMLARQMCCPSSAVPKMLKRVIRSTQAANLNPSVGGSSASSPRQ